ncbi:hypothetical protein EJ03DRAFT_143763 [Teratosphaeria nubilosa]|uniref:Uncharacterized protein n=1 Tax=Teratosphaeria nubilosa TaxID=161662 RepID=A0A6G1L5Y0_9PEZI|nr:hypothetical protein EJ03DRAFT_143763 [Teratosphaeria nubilosa]
MLTGQLGSRETCANQCLQAIARMHRNRILTRLGSSKAEHCQAQPFRKSLKRQVQIGSRIRALMTELRTKPRGHGRKSSDLMNRLDEFAASIDNCEKASHSGEHEAIIAMLKAACSITADGATLVYHLGEQFEGRKEIRQTQALANYWRICVYLSTAARCHRFCFQKITYLALPAPPPSNWRGLPHFVHAEIQIALYLAGQAGMRSPQYIGTSKRACFLCFHFLRSYGGFDVTESHGEVHPQWTIPDSQKYTVIQTESIKRALRRTHAVLKDALKAAKIRGAKYANAPPTPQSTINLAVQPLPTPTASTVTSIVSSQAQTALKAGGSTDTLRAACQPQSLSDQLSGPFAALPKAQTDDNQQSQIAVGMQQPRDRQYQHHEQPQIETIDQHQNEPKSAVVQEVPALDCASSLRDQAASASSISENQSPETSNQKRIQGRRWYSSSRLREDVLQRVDSHEPSFGTPLKAAPQPEPIRAGLLPDIRSETGNSLSITDISHAESTMTPSALAQWPRWDIGRTDEILIELEGLALFISTEGLAQQAYGDVASVRVRDFDRADVDTHSAVALEKLTDEVVTVAARDGPGGYKQVMLQCARGCFYELSFRWPER